MKTYKVKIEITNNITLVKSIKADNIKLAIIDVMAHSKESEWKKDQKLKAFAI